MARPQQYNRTQALKNAMELFWRQGYTATNLPQLLENTDLSRSSFYSAFSDKRQLFIECFELYVKDIPKLLEFVRQSNDPAEAIYHYFSILLRSTKSKQMSNGCFIVNTLLEFEDLDAELHQLARQTMDLTTDAFMQCFENAIAAGNIDRKLTAEQLTEFLSTFFAGIQVQRRAGLDLAKLRSQLDIFVSLIGARPLRKQVFGNYSNITEAVL